MLRSTINVVVGGVDDNVDDDVAVVEVVKYKLEIKSICNLTQYLLKFCAIHVKRILKLKFCRKEKGKNIVLAENNF